VAKAMPDAAVTIDSLREQIRKLNLKIADIEGELVRAEADNDALKYELRDQKTVADDYAAVLEQLDDLLDLPSLPVPLRLALSEFGRAIGSRAVIFG
jgi:chromosome segregation ATPase